MPQNSDPACVVYLILGLFNLFYSILGLIGFFIWKFSLVLLEFLGTTITNDHTAGDVWILRYFI